MITLLAVPGGANAPSSIFPLELDPSGSGAGTSFQALLTGQMAQTPPPLPSTPSPPSLPSSQPGILLAQEQGGAVASSSESPLQSIRDEVLGLLSANLSEESQDRLSQELDSSEAAPPVMPGQAVMEALQPVPLAALTQVMTVIMPAPREALPPNPTPDTGTTADQPVMNLAAPLQHLPDPAPQAGQSDRALSLTTRMVGVSDAATPAMDRQALPLQLDLETVLEPAAAGAPQAMSTEIAAMNGNEPGLPRLAEPQIRPASAPVQASVEAPVRSPEFPRELTDKVVWMAGRREQWAELSLNPANLGAVEVRLSLTEEGAGAQFFAATPQAREALEAALPKLKELLSQAGIALQDASVHDQGQPRRDQASAWGRRADISADEDEAPVSISLRSARTHSGLGLVDLYA